LIALVSADTWLIVAVLITCNIVNVMLMKERRFKKRGKVVISLLSTSIIGSTAASLYSHYALEPLHIMNHTLFKTAYIFSMLILVQGNILTVLSPLYNLIEVNVFDQLNYFLPKIGLAGAKSLYNLIEVNVFDQLNYLFARITIKTAKIVRRIQTGKLNLNMLMILVFFLLCLIILIL